MLVIITSCLKMFSYLNWRKAWSILRFVFNWKKLFSQLTDSAEKKPEIISLYNRYKGGVDTLDHLDEIYTTRRRTNKWTVNTMYYIFDVAAYNLVALERIINPPHANVKTNFSLAKHSERRNKLIGLCIGLMSPHIKNRINEIAKTNFTGIQKSVKDSLK